MSDTEQIRQRLSNRMSGNDYSDLLSPYSGEDNSETSVSEWDGLLEPAVSNMDKLGTIGKYALGGLAEGGVSTAAMLKGAKTGLELTRSPYGMVAGGVAGLAAGGFAGDVINPLNPETDPMMDELRPYAIGGEVAGQAFSGGGIAYRVAKKASIAAIDTGFSLLDRVLKSVVHKAQTRPKEFIATEALGAAGAGLGGGATSEQSQGVRTLSEIAGGAALQTISPTMLVYRMSNAIKSSVAMMGIGQAGQEKKLNAAADYIYKAVLEAGEDPEKLMMLAKERGIINANQTSAIKTNSHALSRIQNAIIKNDSVFSEDIAKMNDDYYDTSIKMIAAMRGTKDPAMLRAAAQSEMELFKLMLSNQAEVAINEAKKHAFMFDPNTMRGREAISKELFDTVDNAMADGRAAERILYGSVKKNIPVEPSEILKGWNYEMSRLPEWEAKMPKIVKDFMGRVEDGDKITSGEMMLMRSELLSLARQSAANPNTLNEARIYGILEGEILKDLDNSNLGDSYNTARNFSRAFHDTFTRTFAGDVLAKKGTGARRIAPEALLKNATGPGHEITDLRLKQLQDAVDFLPKQDEMLKAAGKKGVSVDLVGQATKRSEKMVELQTEAVNLVAAQMFDPRTGGFISETAAQSLLNPTKKFGTLLKSFPEVKVAVERALKSEQARKSALESTGHALTEAERRSAFGMLLKNESPVDVVAQRLSSAEPAKDFDALARFAVKHGSDSSDALRAAVFDNAFRKAGSGFGANLPQGSIADINHNVIYKELFEPIRPGLPSQMDILVKNGIVKQEEADMTRKFFKEIVKLQDIKNVSGTEKAAMEIKQASLLSNFWARIAGSKAAISVAEPLGLNSSSLIVGGAGSTLARSTLAKLNTANFTDFIKRASKEPAFLADLMKRGKEAELNRLGMQSHAYMLMAFGDLFEGEQQ